MMYPDKHKGLQLNLIRHQKKNSTFKQDTEPKVLYLFYH